MSLITIKQKGSFRYKNNRIQTPCIMTVSKHDEYLILKELDSNNLEHTITHISEKEVSPFIKSNQFKLNYEKDEIDLRDFKAKNIIQDKSFKASIFSQIIDYTSQMSPVKDQGDFGSCVAFATVAMKEWQEQQEYLRETKLRKNYKRKSKYYDLSEQWIYYKCKDIDGHPKKEGTSIRIAMKILNKIGVPCEKAWKYNVKYEGKPKSWANLIALWALSGSYYRISTPDELIQSLKENGPVVIGIGCFREIFLATGNGIVNYPKDPLSCYGGHAICIVGWDPSRRLFKFKNSWGTVWGQKGYGYLPYKYIQDFMWDGWFIKDLSVTKTLLRERGLIHAKKS